MVHYRMNHHTQTTMNTNDLGYNDFFEESRRALGLRDFPVARVVSEYRGAYRVRNERGEFLASVTGKQMFSASSREDYPAVGDWVSVEELPHGRALIKEILKRRTVIKRRYGDKNRTGEKEEVQIIAANIDVAFVVESADRDYSLNRFERYFALAESGGVIPAIILNKTDLLSEDELGGKISELKNRFPHAEIVLTSIVNREGLSELKDALTAGKSYCFLGSSGVGKSSLVNELLGEAREKTGEIGSRSGRGKHVTTRRQMYFLENGAIVIDNPGMREVGLSDAAGGVDALLDDITGEGEKCKFADCTHTHEPGCVVMEAARSGAFDEEKYLNYINLKKEAEYSEMSDHEKRGKDRQFGKLLNNAKKDLKKFRHKDY